MFRSQHVCAGLLAALLLTNPVRAVPAADPPAKAEAPAEKYRKALDQVLSVEYDNLPLAGIFEALCDRTKVKFVFDRNFNPDPNTPDELVPPDPEGATVTLKRANIKVRTVLRSVLNQHNLTYVYLVDEDAVLITTRRRAIEWQLKQEVSIDFDKTPLDKALRQLARDTGVNVVIDTREGEKSQTAISLYAEDVPLETCVALMAEMAGLKPVRQANVLFITSKDVAAEYRREDQQRALATYLAQSWLTNPIGLSPFLPGTPWPWNIGCNPLGNWNAFMPLPSPLPLLPPSPAPSHIGPPSRGPGGPAAM